MMRSDHVRVLGPLLIGAAVSLPGMAAGTSGNAAATTGFDVGTAVEACVDKLPATGGDCDLRSATGKMIVSRALIIRRGNVHVLLPPGTIEVGARASISILAQGVVFEGAGRAATTLATMADRTFIFGSADVISRHWRLRRLGIRGMDHAIWALALRNAREGRMDEVTIADFKRPGGGGVLVAENCWTVVVDDVAFVRNDVGIAFRGANLNAWVFRSANFSANRIGASFEMGAQGVSFVAGTHFEENALAGISISSGDVYGLDVSDAYVELTGKQSLLLVRRAGKDPVRLHSFSYSSGFLLSGSAPSFDVEASGPEDFADVTLLSALIRQRETAPAVRSAGSHAHVKVSGGGIVSHKGAHLKWAEVGSLEGGTFDVVQ